MVEHAPAPPTSKQTETEDDDSTNTQPEDLETTAEILSFAAPPKLPESQFKTNLERFHFICKDLPSPKIFIDFDFYFMIASCLNRKVWIGDVGEIFRLYPNLYIICVADPGVGKSLPASAASRLLSTLTETRLDKKSKQYYVVKLINLGPDAITFEKLVLRAHAASEVVKDVNGKYYHHSSTTFCLADEMEMLFTDNNKRVVTFLNQGWDCRDYQGDTIKHGEVVIKNVCINFLGCCVPETIQDLMMEKTIKKGFTARALFLYDNKKYQTVTKIETTKAQEEEGKIIQRHLRRLATLAPSEVKYTAEAYAWLDNWTHKKLDKFHNEHPKLKDYYGRRQAHLIKLAMNVHYSESVEHKIEVSDFIAAEKLQLRAEQNMHLALSGGGENANFKTSEEIKKFLQQHGATKKQTLILKFYQDCSTEKLVEIFDYLVDTEQCNAVTKDGKPALCLNQIQQHQP